MPASPTDLRSLVENYVYPLIVCEEEGKIVFFNGAAQAAFGDVELLGRPLPESWMGADDVLIETADMGKTSFRLIWEEIMWDGNVAWYLVAVPSSRGGGGPAEAEAEELRRKLEESQETAAVETTQLRARLEKAKEVATREVERLRALLAKAETEAAAEIDELRERLERSQELAASAADTESLRQELEKSTEMMAVEADKRQAAEQDRDKLEAKLRDLHQRSLSKLEAARNALESERAERNQLSERLARLKQETDNLRQQLEEKSFEVESVRHQSGEHFEKLKSELLKRTEALSARESELVGKEQALAALEQRVAEITSSLEAKQQELSAAEERAERYRREYEELDREMVQSQEKTALLTAKLQTLESRLERYQRLMDRDVNEFSLGGQTEEELERLRSRVEDLEVELAATRAQSASEGAELAARTARIAELERELEAAASSATGNGATSLLQRKLRDTEAVLEELRFRRDLEYQEVQGSLRRLQERFADVRVNGASPETELVAELEDSLRNSRTEFAQLRERFERLKEELEASREAAQSVPLLRERIDVLEENLREAREAREKGMGAGTMARVRELQEELQEARLRAEQAASEAVQARAEAERAQQQASPQELQQARRRISELEAALANRPPGAAGEVEEGHAAQALREELARAREQLAEMNQELRRTLEGDRETKKLAYADQLTGLPNLNLTGQYLQVCFERSSRREGALALILIDLDHFRRVNDALGQKAGDELLRQVGARLQRSVTEKDTAIARRGEDEFMVVAFMEGVRADGEALMARIRGIAHNLLNELAKPFEISDQKVQITASLGVALYPGPAPSKSALLEQAEHAMYRAKENGRARVSFYTDDMHNTRERRRFLEAELRQAVGQGQFGLVYQPIYELGGNKVVGVEALLRWAHPQRGMLEPVDFLEVAEDTGLIVQIGEQMIGEALAIAKQKFMKRKFICLNLSYRQLIDSGFSARFMKHLQVAGVPPHEVIVEIAEKAARIDPDRIRNALAHLAHWGVGIALDDFGTGSSELSHLTDHTLRVLKIDGKLIRRIPDDRAATKLCQAISHMANALDIPVLAEGVETREQLAQVTSIGCQYAQGFVLSAPLNANQLIQIL